MSKELLAEIARLKKQLLQANESARAAEARARTREQVLLDMIQEERERSKKLREQSIFIAGEWAKAKEEVKKSHELVIKEKGKYKKLKTTHENLKKLCKAVKDANKALKSEVIKEKQVSSEAIKARDEALAQVREINARVAREKKDIVQEVRETRRAQKADLPKVEKPDIEITKEENRAFETSEVTGGAAEAAYQKLLNMMEGDTSDQYKISDKERTGLESTFRRDVEDYEDEEDEDDGEGGPDLDDIPLSEIHKNIREEERNRAKEDIERKSADKPEGESPEAVNAWTRRWHKHIGLYRAYQTNSPKYRAKAAKHPKYEEIWRKVDVGELELGSDELQEELEALEEETGEEFIFDSEESEQDLEQDYPEEDGEEEDEEMEEILEDLGIYSKP